MNTALQPLPSVTDSEAAAIGCALQCPSTRTRALRQLSDDHFHLPAHRIVWGIIRELGAHANTVSIQEKLLQRGLLEDAGGPGAIFDLFNAAPSVAYFDHYANEIRDAYDRRKAISAGHRIIDAAHDFEGDYRQAAATALSEMAAQRRGAEAPMSVREMCSEFVDDLEERAAGRRRNGIATRFEKLNSILGALADGNLIVVGGGRGSGKSILAQNFVEDAMAEGKRALWFSYEMPRREILCRLIASQASVPGRVLFDPFHNPPTQAHINAMTRTLKAMQDDDLLLLRDQQMTVDEIRLETLDATSKGNVGIVVVDYLQLVPAVDARANREQQVATISRKLRALAMETNLPVVALSQLNREGDARESMAIEQDASVILKLTYRDDEALKSGAAALKIDKNRNGRSHCAVEMQHERGFFRFIEN